MTVVESGLLAVLLLPRGYRLLSKKGEKCRKIMRLLEVIVLFVARPTSLSLQESNPCILWHKSWQGCAGGPSLMPLKLHRRCRISVARTVLSTVRAGERRDGLRRTCVSATELKQQNDRTPILAAQAMPSESRLRVAVRA